MQKKDYNSLLKDIEERYNALGAERYHVVKEWGKDLCSWLSEVSDKQNKDYIFIKNEQYYFAIKKVRNSIIKCGDLNQIRGVGGTIVFECLRFKTDKDTIAETFYGEYYCKIGEDFIEISPEEWQQTFENVIKRLFVPTDDNIKYQYDNFPYYLDRIVSDHPYFMYRQEVNYILNKLLKLEGNDNEYF